MVTPLKLWRHQEPKYLWWALAGLSAIAHIGMLGFSLPYMLERMSVESDARAIVPVKLVLVEEDELVTDDLEPSNLDADAVTPSGDRSSTSVNSGSESNSSTGQGTEKPAARSQSLNVRTNSDSAKSPVGGQNPPSDSQSSRPAASPQSPPMPSSVGSSSAGVEAASQPSGSLPSGINEGNSAQRPAPDAPLEGEDSNGDSNSPASNAAQGAESDLDSSSRSDLYEESPISDESEAASGSGDSSGDFETEGSGNGNPDAEEPGAESPGEDLNDLESEAAPSDGDDGGLQLPSPNPGEGQTQRQAVAFRVVGSTIAPVENFDAEPPRLTNLSNPIALQSQERCGRIDFSQLSSQQTYRIKVSAAGLIAGVSLLSNGRGIQLSDTDPLNCVIRSAGMTFTPAMLEGEPITNDSLLLEIEIVESLVQ